MLRHVLPTLLLSLGTASPSFAQGPTVSERNEALFTRMQKVYQLTDDQMSSLRQVFSKSGFMGQGNPAVTEYAATKEQCEDNARKAGRSYENPAFEKICGAKYMAPLYDPSKGEASKATACIDQFEFPGIPCEYPVVWVRANEAAQACNAVGKRLCDAHEWEGACAGALEEPDYAFAAAKGKDAGAAARAMRQIHNSTHDKQKTWAYGKTYRKGVCGGNSKKHDGCNGGDWKKCGSNTYPSGFFPDCQSSLGVYDQHGNAAEHMNLPLDESQMASRGSKTLGHTEMKGSWFIFDKFKAHEDACRWRAPYWHGSKVMDEKSHHNYHLGFRCCKTIE